MLIPTYHERIFLLIVNSLFKNISSNLSHIYLSVIFYPKWAHSKLINGVNCSLISRSQFVHRIHTFKKHIIKEMNSNLVSILITFVQQMPYKWCVCVCIKCYGSFAGIIICHAKTNTWLRVYLRTRGLREFGDQA